MAKPTLQAVAALKRVCRFLSGNPRLIYCYPLQFVEFVDVHTDTDCAGCPTRKSTSGGSVMLGAHAMKGWSSTGASTSPVVGGSG